MQWQASFSILATRYPKRRHRAKGQCRTLPEAAYQAFGYDAFGRVVQTTFPSSLIETYGYDPAGNLTSKTDRKGQTIQYVYDSLYRLTTKIYPDSSTANYVYDLVGKIRQVTDPTGTYAFAYDNMGRLTGTSTQYSFLPGYNLQNSYAYDAASNRVSMTATDGSTNGYNYDTLNRLSTLTSSLTGQFGFSYDALSRRTQLSRPNGIATNYNYDSVSNLLSILHQSSSTTVDGATYNYDYVGNRTSKTNELNGNTSNYAYDAIYELLGVTGGTTESYGYDSVGNRLSSENVSSCTYNTSNQLISNSNGSYTYDANGNTLTDPSGNQCSWDFENRLTRVVVSGTGTVTFKYDPFGRGIFKNSPHFAGVFAYDGYNLVDTINSSGSVTASYTMTQNIDEPLAMQRSTTASYYEADALGSITSLTSSTGSVANTYTYDSFGNLTNSTGISRNPFQYAGREYDNETSLYFDRFRYYTPSAGRFLSEDPIGFSGSGGNFYAYVSNSPLDSNDPLGLCPSSKTRTYLKCIADEGQAGSIQNLTGMSNTIISGAIAGNDFSTLINLSLNNDLPGNLGQTVTSNPTDWNLVNISAQLILSLRTGTTRAILRENSAGTVYVGNFVKDPLAASWGGTILRGGLNIITRAKIIWDAGATLRGIYRCASGQ